MTHATTANNHTEPLESLREEYRALQDVIGLSAHEWRSHLTLLYIQLELLHSQTLGPLTASQRDTLHTMRTSVTVMRHIACNYLMAVVLEGQRFEITPCWHGAASEIFRPLASGFSYMAQQTGQTIEIDIPPDDLRVWGDPVLMQIALENLLHNALKYGQPGGRIKMRGREVKGAAELSVWNDGAAPSQDQVQRWFLRFAREVASPAHGGTGLGLHIVKQIIEAHQGTVRVASLPGHWIEFTLRLPFPNGQPDQESL